MCHLGNSLTIVHDIHQFILATFILFTGIFLTRYAHSSWIPPSSLEMQVMDRLESVLIATASQSMVHNAVNKLVDRAISFLLDILSLFDGAGILRLDCFLLGSFLTDLCGKSSNSTFSDFACTSLTGAITFALCVA